MVTETYQQISYFGDKIEVEEDWFILSQLVLGTRNTGEIRIATSVGTSPLQRKRNHEGPEKNVYDANA